MKYRFYKYEHTFIFSVLLLCVAMYFNFNHAFNDSIKGELIEQQAISASIAQHYTTENSGFTNPQTHDLATSLTFNWQQPPLVEYFVAIFYKIFSVNDGLYKLLSFLIFASGLLGLSKLIRLITEDDLLSFIIPLLLFGSPVVTFWSFNTYPIATSLGLSLIGWHFFIRYIHSNQHSTFYIAILLLSLGLWIDTTMIISTLLISIGLGINLIFPKFLNRQYHSNTVLTVSGFLFLLGITTWKSLPFLQSLKIPTLDATLQQTIFDNLILSWDFFHWGSILLLSLLLIFIIATPKKHPPFWYTTTLLSALIVIPVSLLFFDTLQAFHYYQFGLLWLPIAILVTISIYIKQHHNDLSVTYGFKIFLVVALLLNIKYAKQQYATFLTPSDTKQTIQTNTLLTKKKIDKSATIIYLPTTTPNASLYRINRKGWNNINKKADYLIITDSRLLGKPDIKPYLINPIGNFRSQVFLYDLK